MKFQVSHATHHTYSHPVGLCHNEIHLRPREFELQVCSESRIQIEPLPACYHERSDYLGNRVGYFSLQEPHDRLTVTAKSTVHRTAVPARDMETSVAWDHSTARLRAADQAAVLAAREYVLDSPLVAAAAELAAFALSSFAPGRPLLSAVHDLNSRVHREFTYDPSGTTVSTPLAAVLEQRRGVCQDFAHLAIG